MPPLLGANERGYQYPFVVRRKNGEAFLIEAFSEPQAIAKTANIERLKDKYFCVCIFEFSTGE